MRAMKIHTQPEVEAVFRHYPDFARQKLLDLRELILEAAGEIEEIQEVEEALKWGEPSYLVKKGSTVRIDWKERSPEQFAIYFKCTSKLVPTFRKRYAEVFTFEGDRAIVFAINKKLPKAELKDCIKAALSYHRVKHLPDLGM
ncbi:MAG: DUF1801 domain-containing protein [Anaerolineales bacterium]|nr:DUF1801 domain-containing protein [Anaerolineales bacterium]MCW5854766.1 DUF1801 domain-containing protein [Anaerolineales bacterium]